MKKGKGFSLGFHSRMPWQIGNCKSDHMEDMEWSRVVKWEGNEIRDGIRVNSNEGHFQLMDHIAFGKQEACGNCGKEGEKRVFSKRKG